MIKAADILVIGGGIGGLAAATALAQRGASVCVLEQASEIGEVGAGLQISPNGLAVVRGLGLEAELTRRSVRGAAVRLLRAEDDREVARLDLTRLPQTQAYLFVHRADLIEVLLEGARAAGVRIELGARVRDIVAGPDAEVILENGARRRTDLIVDAGGLHSRLRGVLNGADKPFFTGQVAWRAIVPNVENRKAAVHVHMAPRSHMVSYPLRGGAFLNLVAVQERSAWAAEGWAHDDDPANLRAVFAKAGAGVQGLLEQVQQVNLWGLFRHPVAQNWTGDKCALVGDAAHPTLPFLAQGANMALEDAWALAAMLDRYAPEQALPAYQALRSARATRVIEAANKNAWRYHLKHGPLRFAAHSALRLVSGVAPSVMMHQFDWLYGYDITQAAAAIAADG